MLNSITIEEIEQVVDEMIIEFHAKALKLGWNDVTALPKVNLGFFMKTALMMEKIIKKPNFLEDLADVLAETIKLYREMEKKEGK